MKSKAITMRAHDTFYIRKGWLDKGMRKVSESPTVFTAKDPNPMDALGIGANMVKSLRYWMQATGLTCEPGGRARKQELTTFGRIVYTYDPYIEEPGTLWALHHKLVTNEQMATSWYYFFNVFPLKSFSRDEYAEMIRGYLDLMDEYPSRRAIEDDFNCIIGTYTPKERLNPKKASPENNIDCPLSELYLTDVENKRKHLYRKMSISCGAIPWQIMAYATHHYARNAYKDGRLEIPLSDLDSAPCSPGRVFNLDMLNLTACLYELERQGFAKVVRTAGLDVVQLRPIDDLAKKYDDQEQDLVFIERYYRDMGMGGRS